MSESVHAPVALLSKHRIEALTDGIYAVAMTLLVIDLKVPDRHEIASIVALDHALGELVWKAVAWVISFFVLAIFWLSNQRLYHYVRVVDSTLVWRGILQLAFISLLPFSASMIGGYSEAFEAHIIYNGNMVVLALMSLWQLRYVHHHPELTPEPMPTPLYRAALLRTSSLATLGLIAIVIAALHGPLYSTYVYMLMAPIGRIAARISRGPVART
jgi:TMEM175 potassium channel family protein